MNVRIFGQRELKKRIEAGKKVYSHCISIGNPGRGRHRPEAHRMPKVFRQMFTSILRLEFYDVEEKRHLGRIRPKRVPEKRDVKKIIRYFEKTRDRATGYTIHCWRGVSRSAAVGLIVLYLIHRDEQKAARELIRIRGEAAPHRRLVEYFDEIMGTGLSGYSRELWKEKMHALREWFFREIDNGDALVEELESVD